MPIFRLAPRRTRSGIGRACAGNHFEQCGLTGAIPAHHCPAFSAADCEAESVVDHAWTVALAQIFEYRDLIAGSRRHAKFELHDLPFLRELDLFDLVQRFDTALHLSGFGGVGLEALDKTLFLGEHGLLARKRCLLIGLANRALPFIEIVVTRVSDDLSGVDLGDLRNKPIHELAVMRGHQ